MKGKSEIILIINLKLIYGNKVGKPTKIQIKACQENILTRQSNFQNNWKLQNIKFSEILEN